jgi:hypothetical protein
MPHAACRMPHAACRKGRQISMQFFRDDQRARERFEMLRWQGKYQNVIAKEWKGLPGFALPACSHEEECFVSDAPSG